MLQISWNDWQIVSAGKFKVFDIFYKSNRVIIGIKIPKESCRFFQHSFLCVQIENVIFAKQSNTFGICCDVFFVIKIQ